MATHLKQHEKPVKIDDHKRDLETGGDKSENEKKKRANNEPSFSSTIDALQDLYHANIGKVSSTKSIFIAEYFLSAKSFLFAVIFGVFACMLAILAWLTLSILLAYYLNAIIFSLPIVALIVIGLNLLASYCCIRATLHYWQKVSLRNSVNALKGEL